MSSKIYKYNIYIKFLIYLNILFLKYNNNIIKLISDNFNAKDFFKCYYNKEKTKMFFNLY